MNAAVSLFSHQSPTLNLWRFVCLIFSIFCIFNYVLRKHNSVKLVSHHFTASSSAQSRTASFLVLNLVYFLFSVCLFVAHFTKRPLRCELSVHLLLLSYHDWLILIRQKEQLLWRNVARTGTCKDTENIDVERQCLGISPMALLSPSARQFEPVDVLGNIL